MHVVVSRLRAEEKQISCSNARNSSWFGRIFHMPAKAHIVTVGLIQMRCTSEPQANLRKGLALVGKAARRGARIICLPELFRSLYFCQTEDHRQFALAEPIPGPTTTALAKAARQYRVTIVGSVFEKRSAGVYHNTAVIFNARGKLVGKYRKMHIPDDPLYYEKFYFAPGDLGFQSFGWHRNEKKQFGKKQHEAWVTIQRSHAIANGVFVAAANRIGLEGTVQFWGGSFVCDPFGEIIAQASHDREEVLLAKCDLREVEKTRQHWPFLRDRRIDAYDGITQRLLD
jgi:N-carbamoylputrescine amidase